jgi:hypothetical protein
MSNPSVLYLDLIPLRCIFWKGLGRFLARRKLQITRVIRHDVLRRSEGRD